MGASLNKVLLIGRLGKDAELRYSAQGKGVMAYSLAVDDGYGDKKRTEWVNVVHFEGKSPLDRLAEMLTKGQLVYVEGRLQTRSWESDGQKHYKTEVVAFTVQLLGGGRQERREEQEWGDGELPFE